MTLFIALMLWWGHCENEKGWFIFWLLFMIACSFTR